MTDTTDKQYTAIIKCTITERWWVSLLADPTGVGWEAVLERVMACAARDGETTTQFIEPLMLMEGNHVETFMCSGKATRID